jgi:2-dehydro-3-deoxyphosphogluconate aldolase/(4S)-4-hydroxy-2-oxoglutarate aldolase
MTTAETSASEGTIEKIIQSRIVAIVRLARGGPLVDVARALAAGGITALEFTLTTPGAVDAIEESRNALGDAVTIGAGTVLTAGEAERCIAAGAQFIVSPAFDEDVVDVTKHAGVAALPGALTPTEITAAWRAGADAIKIFPVRSFGPRYISDLLAPLPHLRLVPTGGIDATNAADYLAAGAVAVGVGGNLVDERLVAAGDWESITQRARDLVLAVGHA